MEKQIFGPDSALRAAREAQTRLRREHGAGEHGKRKDPTCPRCYQQPVKSKACVDEAIEAIEKAGSEGGQQQGFAEPEHPRIQAIRRIVKEHQHGKVEGHHVDSFSASAILNVHDALSPENRKKFLALPVPKMASVAFKLHRSGPVVTLAKANQDADAPVGEGGRFAALKRKLGRREDVEDPGALAAYIGRRKYGKKRFQRMAAAGKSWSDPELAEALAKTGRYDPVRGRASGPSTGGRPYSPNREWDRWDAAGAAKTPEERARRRKRALKELASAPEFVEGYRRLRPLGSLPKSTALWIDPALEAALAKANQDRMVEAPR